MQTTINKPTVFQVSFGSSWGGIATVGYTLKNPDGSTTPAPAAPRSTAGVVDDGDGYYHVILTFTQPWSGFIYWDISPGSPIAAQEDVQVNLVSPTTGGVETPIPGLKKQSLSLGPRSTPQEVKDLRKAVLDKHLQLGMPVIHKRRWTLKDVRDGHAKICPLHDDALDSSGQWDNYCFGTGILGGWQDGAITYMTLSDTQEDTIRVGPGGALLFDRHPAFTAPWLPEMGDGDLIITADFDLNTWDILEERERYVLQEVTPKTMRGFQSKVQTKEYRVHQSGQVDKLPYDHEWYRVPIVFDYIGTPIPTGPGPGDDPDDYPFPSPTQGRYTEFSMSVRITGSDPGWITSATERSAKVIGFGNATEHSQGVRVRGTSEGSIIIFPEDY